MKNDRDELDDLIDGALPGYSSSSPIDGLEERVLQRIQLAETPRRSAWPYRLAFAVPAVAALLLVGIALQPWRSPGPRAAKAVPGNRAQEVAALKPRSTAATPDVAALPPKAVEPKARARAGQKPGSPLRVLPKQQFFPAPSPMTEEERVLVAWAGRAPREARQAFLDLQKRTDEPVAIQKIQIPPLQSDGAQ